MISNIDNRSKLDISKERLAKAFRNLEMLIDKKLASNLAGSNNSETRLLKKKLDDINDEKEKLEISYSNIYEKYANIKLLNLEVIEELNNSIKDIEDILNNNYGNNS